MSGLGPETLSRCSDAARCAFLHGKLLTRAANAMRDGARRFDAVLQPLLNDLPSPERSLVQLDRYIEASFGPSSLLEDFCRMPTVLEQFLRLGSSSKILIDILVRDPELFRWLTTTGILAAVRTREELFTAVADVFGVFHVTSRALPALKRVQRRELLRIGARDLLGMPELAITTQELSWLADAIVSGLFSHAAAIVEERHGRTLGTPMCLIALGKLGGEELNYSSDIDLMAVYGENLDRGGFSSHELAVRILEQLIRFLTEPGLEGILYRTDFRLRPDGGAGALALSLPATLAYYEARGALWERQMLLKARVIAGDADFGADVMQRLRPFVWPRTARLAPSMLLRDVRERLASRWHFERDVKHGRGGIRDIEFSVQALQLLHGADDDRLRSRGTLPALEALHERRLIPDDEFHLLREGYVSLRRLEHALQLEAFEQTHTIPENPDALAALAWTMQFPSVDAFITETARLRTRIKEITGAMLDERGNPEAGNDSASIRAIASKGFPDQRAAEHALRMLIEGRRARPHDTGLRDALREHATELLDDIAREALPDQCLSALEAWINGTPTPTEAAQFLFSPGARPFLLRLAGLAPAHLQKITPHPLVLEAVFGGWAHEQAAGLPPLLSRMIRETDALGRVLLGTIGIDAFAVELSDHADAVLRTTLQRLDGGIAPFAVIALGKYGGGELLIGSDLDLVFVFRPSDAFGTQQAQDLAASLIDDIQSGMPPTYVVDARLRPEGRNSPLAISIDAYQAYLENRASLWEKQSLLRARCVAGAPDVCREIETLVRGHIPPRIDGAAIEEIMTMRIRMEPSNRFRRRFFFDLKRSSGGLVDAEFAAQIGVLALGVRGGPDVPRDTMSALLCVADALPHLASRIDRMRGMYADLRRVQLLLRVMFDSPSNLLPDDDARLHLLARASGFQSGAEWIGQIEAGRRDMRETLLAVGEAVRGH